MDKKYVLKNLREGYFQGIDYDHFEPYFSSDIIHARLFDSEQEAEGNLLEMRQEYKRVEGVYVILPVIAIY